MDSLKECERAIIIGHSFPRRAKTLCLKRKKINLNLEKTLISWVSHIFGKKISTVLDLEKWFKEFHYFFQEHDFVIMEIGSNDLLTKEYYGKPLELADKIMELAILARVLGAKRVVISKILFRSGEMAIPRDANLGRGKTVKQHEKFYNKMVLEVNQKLHHDLRVCGSGLFMNYQEGLVKGWRSKLCDGVHLTDEAYETYLANLKSILIKLSKWLMFEPNPPPA